MQIERRALYNLLRMNWQLDPNIDIEPWQIDNYRALPTERLFDLLRELHIDLDKYHFAAIADTCDTPEELTDYIIGDSIYKTSEKDRIYLILFELWRRIEPAKPCLSVFCDELDHQINLYDQGKISNLEALHDAIADLQAILDENVDQGVPAADVFESISLGCAHDVESFLYDFIAEQIDTSNFSYARELLEGLMPYVTDKKWFNFLNAQVIASTDIQEANNRLRVLVENNPEPDLQFNLELLSFLAREGDHDLFVKLVIESIPLVEVEEDLHEILSTTSDFYHYLDREQDEHEVQEILSKRRLRAPEEPVKRDDPDIEKLIAMMEKSLPVQKRMNKRES